MAALSADKPPRVMTVDLRAGGPYSFPPKGRAYRENGASHRVWRRVLIDAPDVIVVPGGGASVVGATFTLRATTTNHDLATGFLLHALLSVAWSTEREGTQNKQGKNKTDSV